MKDFNELKKSIGRCLDDNFYGRISHLGELISVEMRKDFYGCDYCIATFNNGSYYKKELYGYHIHRLEYTYNGR